MSDRMHFSVRQLFFALASFFGVIFLLHFGRTVLVPLAFSLLIAFILYPLCVFLERRGLNRMWSILWSMIGVTIFIVGITYMFSAQIVNIVSEFDDFRAKLNEVLQSITMFLNDRVNIIPDLNEDNLKEMSKRWFSDRSGGLVTNTLSSTALFISGLVLTIIYTFLLLLYRKGLKNGFVNFASSEKRAKYAQMVDNIQRVGQQYLTGMFFLILIIGTLNTIGLLIIGIDYALFFGFLAAFLAIIPYIGTTMGGAIPAIYAFMNYDSYWYPLGVVLMFWVIQIIDGNFLTPKIVGGNLNLNALVAILALISGGLIWGVAGMILFLPYTAVLKVACDHYVELKPFSDIMGDDLYGKRQPKNVMRRVKKIFKKRR
ncbi:MAG: AI-2E family transporter [Fulvivirga sp.]